MSKIQFEQLSETELEVSLPAETPMEMVQELTKSLAAKGLVEDLKKSTLSTRYFYRPKDKVNTLADRLLKTLEDMDLEKAKKHWWADSQADVDAWKQKNQAIDRADRAKAAGVKIPSGSAPKAPGAPAPTTPNTTSNTSNSNTLPGVSNKLHNPDMSPTVDYYRRNTQKGEDVHEEGNPECGCSKCDMAKSGYGPKGGGQYSVADNIRRKANNVETGVGIGPNKNSKAYTSAKYSGMTPQTDPKLKKPQAVKQWSPEQIAAENKKRGLNKAWGQHNPIPSAEEEIMRYAAEVVHGEDAAANQLAQMMHNKQLLKFNQPSNDEFTAAGEAMGLGVSEEVLKSDARGWDNTMNSWLAEATKPISQRFASEEEEMAYWSKIKVADRKDDDTGY